MTIARRALFVLLVVIVAYLYNLWMTHPALKSSPSHYPSVSSNNDR